jgi:hypothetical protein
MGFFGAGGENRDERALVEERGGNCASAHKSPDHKVLKFKRKDGEIIIRNN